MGLWNYGLLLPLITLITTKLTYYIFTQTQTPLKNRNLLVPHVLHMPESNALPLLINYIIEMLCKHFRLCVCNFIYNSCIIKLENQGILFTEVLIAVTPLLIDLGVQNSERVTLSFKGLVCTDKPIIFSIVVNFQ